MNVFFGITVIISTVMLIFTNPDTVLSSMISGGEKALRLTTNLVVIYAVWMGIFALLEQSGLDKKLAKSLTPVNKFLFGELPPLCNEYVSINVSANFLGVSGATTPFGIKAVEEMSKHKHMNYAITMFFVINATSIQLIPSSVLALRNTFNSINPSSIIIPTILSTLVSSVVGIILVKVFVKK